MKTKLLFSFCFFCFCPSFFAQEKKEIKKNKIKSITVTQTANGKTLSDGKTIYDESGEVIEEVQYTKEGGLKKITKFKLNNLGKVVEEEEYNAKKILVEKRILKYTADGKKSEEQVFNSQQKLIKKHSYKYDSQGIKTERVTVDDTGKIKLIKKYNCQFNN